MLTNKLMGKSGEDKQFIEDLFAVHLYTGTGSTQTITNGIDLSTKGGMVWIKERSANGFQHQLCDTARGLQYSLKSDSTAVASDNSSVGGGITSALTNGFTLGLYSRFNYSAATYASWTFRKAPKFFDVVTYTGNGVAGRQIAHSLGTTPGMIIVKCTSTTSNWMVWQNSVDRTGGVGNAYGILNSTGSFFLDNGQIWGNGTSYTAPTSTNFTISSAAQANTNGATYVAYLFAHDAGGFGAAGTDNVISCGSYTGLGLTTRPSVTLGYEPQYVMVKASSTTGNWVVLDVMRGMSQTNSQELFPNLYDVEAALNPGIIPTATGFTLGTTNADLNAYGVTYIYMAIRRGPMRTPTSGASVFMPVASSVNTGTITSGFPTDVVLSLDRTTGTSAYNRMAQDRLRGSFQILDTASTSAEHSNSTTASFTSNTGIILVGGSVYTNGFVHEQFRRAPGFFDVVCYTGTGSAMTIPHNLGVAPEMIIVKSRSASYTWIVQHKDIGITYALFLSEPYEKNNADVNRWNQTLPTASNFYVGGNNSLYLLNGTFVAYLFASCPGVSKVGSYTGTGAAQTIDCGFTAGARFVLIKRTDSTGNWYTWDSARGIVSGNDPYLLMNSTAAEVTTTDYIDPYAAGFEISSTAPAEINASGGTFIYLAIA